MDNYPKTTDSHPSGELSSGQGKLIKVYDVLSTWHLQIIAILLIFNKFKEHVVFNVLSMLATCILAALAIAQILTRLWTKALKEYYDITLNTSALFIWILVGYSFITFRVAKLKVQALFNYLHRWGTYLGGQFVYWSIKIGTWVLLLLAVSVLPLFLTRVLHEIGMPDKEVVFGGVLLVIPNIFVFLFPVPFNWKLSIGPGSSCTDASDSLAEVLTQDNVFWTWALDNKFRAKIILTVLAIVVTPLMVFTVVLAHVFF